MRAGCPRSNYVVHGYRTFQRSQCRPVYRRFHEKGRMMPDGLVYIDSWIETNYDRCFQLMECEQPELFEQWTRNWDDIADFEIIPVVTSKEARERIEPML